MRVAEDELHAYVDGLLAPEDRARIESYLSAFPDERERVETYRHHNVLLHRLFDWHKRPRDESVYDELAERYRSAERASARVGNFARAAAMLMVVLASGAVGWASYGLFAEPETLHTEFIHQAAEAHSLTNARSFSDDRFAAAATADAKLLDWIASEKRTVPRRAPDFRQKGYQLVGGRVLPTGYGPAVQFLYAGPGDRRVTLFIGRPRSSEPPIQTLVEDGTLTMIHRQVGALAYSLIGNVDGKMLMGMAEVVSASLKSGHRADRNAATVEELGEPALAAPPRQSISDGAVPRPELARPENVSRPAVVSPETDENPTKRF